MANDPQSTTPGWSRILGLTALLFVASVVLRVLFWRATPDAVWAYSAYYKGDAPAWLDYVRALRGGEVFEWGLPLRPPGMAYLLDLLWDGTVAGLERAKLIWCVLGATVPGLFFLSAVRTVGFRAAAIAGTGMAVSTGLLFLSTSINNEIPYLILVALGLILLVRVREKPNFMLLALWSALNALTCLVRVEHTLFYLLCLGYLFLSWAGARPRMAQGRRATFVAVCVFSFVVPLAPWHLSAWNRIDRFNHQRLDLGEPTETSIATIDSLTRGMQWEPAAIERRDALPAFAAHFWNSVVVATVGYRGRTTVRAEDFDILEEAFGYYPKPIASHPFITLTGPINFYMTNNALATGGFSRDILEAPPPLEGGADRYPPFFTKDFPPGGALSLWYPPHLAALNRGYDLGWRWIRENPGDYLHLLGEKLGRFWAGSSLGWGGFGFPIGVSGIRHRVDLAIPKGPVCLPWRVAVLAACAIGIGLALRLAGALPWVLFLVTQIVAASLFFGFARLGATAIPAVAVLVAVALDRGLLAPAAARGVRGLHRVGLWCSVILVLAVSAELVRYSSSPELYIRGRAVGSEDPYPVKLYIDQELQVRH